MQRSFDFLIRFASFCIFLWVHVMHGAGDAGAADSEHVGAMMVRAMRRSMDDLYIYYID